jgi:hypothetical protein
MAEGYQLAYDRTESAIENVVKELRVELERTLEAAKRIEELVKRLRAK